MTTQDAEVLQARIQKLETRISNHTNLFIVLVVVAVFVAYLNSRPNEAMFVYNDAGDAVAWASVGIGIRPVDRIGRPQRHGAGPPHGPGRRPLPGFTWPRGFGGARCGSHTIAFGMVDGRFARSRHS